MESARRCPAIMIQGTGSNVGKSLLVAGLARAFANRGLKVRPFKPQNMSNNAAAAPDGGEIGRAQALQALAARVAPSVHMNPVLLKPESDTGSQIIVQGQRWGTMRAGEFGKRKSELLPHVIESFNVVLEDADLIVVEGAGSPAEINLRAGDIANMGFAEAVDLPVAIVGDIERGGVIANLIGTHAILASQDATRIKAFLINKFRGDPGLFAEGLREIEARTGWQGLGILPFFPAASKLPAEDILDIRHSGDTCERVGNTPGYKVVVPQISRIANFDDLDPLKLEPGVELDIVEPGRPLPRDADLILLPGSKSTIADLEGLRSQGWDIDIAAHIRQDGYVLGVCGGFQMLGRWIDDNDGVEGRPGRFEGLGHLDVETELTDEKVVGPVTGIDIASGAAVGGYEIHLGRTGGPDMVRPLLEIEGRKVGAQSASGRVIGTYVHGIFQSDPFRRAFLGRLGAKTDPSLDFSGTIDQTLDDLAAHIEEHIDLDAIYRIASSRPPQQ